MVISDHTLKVKILSVEQRINGKCGARSTETQIHRFSKTMNENSGWNFYLPSVDTLALFLIILSILLLYCCCPIMMIHIIVSIYIVIPILHDNVPFFFSTFMQIVAKIAAKLMYRIFVASGVSNKTNIQQISPTSHLAACGNNTNKTQCMEKNRCLLSETNISSKEQKI